MAKKKMMPVADPPHYIPKTISYTRALTMLEYVNLKSALKVITFDMLIDLWWECQAEKAEEIEKWAARCADPNSLVGKTPQQILEYFTRKREAIHEHVSSPELSSDQASGKELGTDGNVF